VGENDGSINYYENMGSNVFTVRIGTLNPFDGIDVGIFSTPAFADLDGDDDLDLVVGNKDGTFKYFENIGNGTSPVFTDLTSNPFRMFYVGRHSAPVFIDVDNDLDLDLVSGERYGFILFYENIGTITSPEFTKRTGTLNPFNGIKVGSQSNPAFADIDGVKKFDLIVGATDGSIRYFETKVSCYDCVGGTYSTSYEATSCTVCSSGRISPTGSSDASACYSCSGVLVALDGECKNCPVDKVEQDGSCVYCDRGNLSVIKKKVV
jgi:hypothetical protein